MKTVGLCHSVQTCSRDLLKGLGMEDKLEGRRELIAGINHMAWLLQITDKDGNDLYPEIRRRAAEKKRRGKSTRDMVRYESISAASAITAQSRGEHNAEYNPLFIKSRYPELIDAYNIPLDEYPRRCVNRDQEGLEGKKRPRFCRTARSAIRAPRNTPHTSWRPSSPACRTRSAAMLYEDAGLIASPFGGLFSY